MKPLLTLTAIIEAPTGLALIAAPAFVVQLLLGAEISGAAIPLGRVAGAALFALGVACWLARYDVQSCAARGLVTAMVLYNLGAVVILGAAGIRSQPVGIALWPAVVVHAAMTVWCVACLRRSSLNATMNSSLRKFDCEPRGLLRLLGAAREFTSKRNEVKRRETNAMKSPALSTETNGENHN